MHRYAFLLLLVGCIPPPAGGYQTQSYGRQSGYSQQNGYGYQRQNGYSQQNGYDDEDDAESYGSTGGYGSPNGGYGDGDNAGGGGGGSWTCDAAAVQDDGSTRKSAYGQGSSRDEAATNALRDCGALAGFDSVITDGRGGGNCEIRNCYSTGG